MKGWNKITTDKIKQLPGVKSVTEVVPYRRKVTEPNGNIISRFHLKPSKEKTWIAWNLWHWCNEHALSLETEYKFHLERKWRFDWSIPALKLGLEYNGIMSEKSRHTTVKGYTGDMEKMNAAQALGYKVLQFTPLNYKEMIKELNKFL